MKYISFFHTYLHHSLLLFEPKSLNESSVKVLHPESKEKYEQDDRPKRTAEAKKRGVKPSCTHCQKEGHDQDNF